MSQKFAAIAAVMISLISIFCFISAFSPAVDSYSTVVDEDDVLWSYAGNDEIDSDIGTIRNPLTELSRMFNSSGSVIGTYATDFIGIMDYRSPLFVELGASAYLDYNQTNGSGFSRYNVVYDISEGFGAEVHEIPSICENLPELSPCGGLTGTFEKSGLFEFRVACVYTYSDGSYEITDESDPIQIYVVEPEPVLDLSLGECADFFTSGDSFSLTVSSNVDGSEFSLSGSASEFLSFSEGLISGIVPDVSESVSYELIVFVETPGGQTDSSTLNFNVEPAPVDPEPDDPAPSGDAPVADSEIIGIPGTLFWIAAGLLLLVIVLAVCGRAGGRRR